MTLDIRMTPEAEAKFKARAAESGKDAGTYASELLEQAVCASKPHGSDKSFEAFLDGLIEEARFLPRNPGPGPQGISAKYAEGVVENLRKQGLKL